MSIVLDASAALSWCLDEVQAERTRPLLSAMETRQAIVPAIWQAEVANALAVSERRQRVGGDRLAEFLELLGRLPIAVDLHCAQRALEHVLPLARRHRVSAYDACYLELALRLGAPLATVDDRLELVARDAGVALLLPPDTAP